MPRNQYERNRTYNTEITLIENIYTLDEIGNTITEEARTAILCDVEAVTRAEFYQASNHGLKPEKEFVIHSFEYGGQSIVECEGIKYNVIRTYETSNEEIELTCERVLGT